MNKVNYEEAYFKCPFFHSVSYSENQAVIRCEGIYDNMLTTISARSSKDLMNFKKSYCMSVKGCEKCHIYKLAEQKYV